MAGRSTPARADRQAQAVALLHGRASGRELEWRAARPRGREMMRWTGIATFDLTAATALVALTALPAVAQDPEPMTIGTDGLYSLPRSQDEIAEYGRAVQEIDEGNFEAAVARLNSLLRNASQGVVPVLGAVDRWVGLRLAVVQTLRDLPADGRAIYERLARRELGASFGADPRELSESQLDHLATRYPTSSAGIRARTRLGDLALEAGDGVAAAQHYRAALDATPRIGEEGRALRRRMEAASLLVRNHAGLALRQDSEIARAVSAAVNTDEIAGWPSYGGGLDGSREMQPPVGDRASSFRFPIRADGFESNPLAMHAVGDLSGILIDDGHSVWCIDPVQREVAWVAPGPMVDSNVVQEARKAINKDIVLACAASPDVVVASLQVPDDVIGAARAQHFRQSISIIEKIPSRRLFAFDRETGKRLWAHWDFKGGPISERFRGHDACGTPLIQGDTIYCATHDQAGAIAFYVSAYDLRTGEPKWRSLICASQQEVNMFGNPRQEFAAGPLALVDGMLVGTTNLGVCFSVDSSDGKLRWITGYETIPLPQTQLREQARRPVYFANNPIVVEDGVFATTPLDSEFALGLDVATGAVEWMLRYEISGQRNATVRWLLGAIDGHFVMSGFGIVAIEARGNDGRARVRFVASASELGEDDYRLSSMPRGAIADGKIFFVGSAGGLRVLDLDGSRDASMADFRASARGNLLLVDGMAVFARSGEVELHGDLATLVRFARRDLEQRPGDPAAYLRLARLERAMVEEKLDGAAAARVEQLFEDGLEAAREGGLGAGSRVHSGLAQGLFRISFERAMRSSEDAPDRAIARFEVARARAVQPDQWLRAQQEIIELSSDDPERMLRELDAMSRRYGRETFAFRGLGRIPVSVYASVRSLEYLDDPKLAAEECQHLMDRHGDQAYGSSTVRELASAKLEELIDEHGRSVYAAIEARAASRLASAGEDPAALRALVERYPHSDAARDATRRLLEQAVVAGDLRIAIEALRTAADRGDLSAGVLRRMVASASEAGNVGLAHALAQRLVDRYGSQVSDFEPDEGATIAEVVKTVGVPEPAARRAPALPVEQLAFVPAPTRSSVLNIVEVEAAPGFAHTRRLPLLLALDATRILCFELDGGLPRSIEDASLAISIDSLGEGPMLACGEILVVVETESVRGIDRNARREAWRFDAGRDRVIRNLGVQSGVLHLYSVGRGRDASDDRRAIGIEPTSGAVLFDRVLPGWRDGAPPIPALGRLWQFDARGDGDGPVIRECDPLFGSVVETTLMSPAVLAAVGLDDDYAHHIYSHTLQTGFAVDERAIYVQVDPPTSPDARPRLVAIERGTGERLWQWAGTQGCSFHRLGVAGESGRLVLFERSGSGSRLLILDAQNGRELRSYVFDRNAAIHNWTRTRLEDAVPETLIISDVDEAIRLSCVSLDPDGPNFRVPLVNMDRLLSRPLLGDGYLLVPGWRSGSARPQIRVLDLETRRGALPQGRNALTLDLSRPLMVQPHDGLVLTASPEGIRLLGRPR